jgi:predicted permease
MMQDLEFSLESTMPIFFVMVLGYIFHMTGIIDDRFAASMNRFVFKIGIPVLLFSELAGSDFSSTWDGKYVLFCFCATILSILIASVFSLMIKSIPERGEFIHASYRSSAAILGIAYITNIYGRADITPLMIIGAVPLYNAAAVAILQITSEKNKGRGKVLAKETAVGIATNPIILGIVFGLAWSLIGLPFPSIAEKTLDYVGRTATPLGLMSLGASIDLKQVSGRLKTSLAAVFIKLILLEAIFLPVAVQLGFRDEKLVAAAVMLGSPTTVTCFVMAKSMGHEGTLSAHAVALSTLLSSFTLTMWIFILRSHGLI